MARAQLCSVNSYINGVSSTGYQGSVVPGFGGAQLPVVTSNQQIVGK